MISCVYKIENKNTGRCYVGSAVDVTARRAVHFHLLKNGRHHSVKLQRSWLKHGEGAFEFTILERVENKANLVAREQNWIDALSAFGLGYNMAPRAGSTLGVKLSDETKAKLSAAHKGRKRGPRSAETKAKLSAAKTGKPGRKHTPEERAARSAFTRGRKHTKEARAKMSAALTGRVVSAEARARISEAGKRRAPCSDETRKKLSAALTGRKVSYETRRKIAAAQRGVPRKPCAKAEKENLSSLMTGKKWLPEDVAHRTFNRALNAAIREAAQ